MLIRTVNMMIRLRSLQGVTDGSLHVCLHAF